MTRLKSVINSAERTGANIKIHTDDPYEKLSFYVAVCTSTFNTRDASKSDSAAVVRFMSQLGLSLSSPPPPGSPSTRDQLLSLHVELAFGYGLSAIMIIRPRPYNSLHVAFNGRMMQAALTRGTDPGYATNLAGVAGVTATTSLIASRTTVYSKMRVAVTSGTMQLAKPTVPAPLVVVQVKDVRFVGPSTMAFADAVEAKTPYKRSATLYHPDLLVSVVKSVWVELNEAELFLWTSWHVVDEVVPFADPPDARMGLFTDAFSTTIGDSLVQLVDNWCQLTFFSKKISSPKTASSSGSSASRQRRHDTPSLIRGRRRSPAERRGGGVGSSRGRRRGVTSASADIAQTPTPRRLLADADGWPTVGVGVVLHGRRQLGRHGVGRPNRPMVGLV
ncbi:hypothetical protein HPB48_016669 [Haemaphysalis longicornis]|uniref:Uncharacterized protein n=1 Tax=Haemaphysalis longicornis TaxID=44386 RepID=A0A9J6H2W8_HAELO|nr:hypothetical protein HPB48_016669 [Haemaphysalis longicornis]